MHLAGTQVPSRGSSLGYFYHHLRQGGIDWSQLVSQLTIILARVLNAVLDREALVKLLCLERELVIRGHLQTLARLSESPFHCMPVSHPSRRGHGRSRHIGWRPTELVLAYSKVAIKENTLWKN